ncbi:MAG: hypothetical protein GY855_01350 [candidate division Zixibacteria bacterium]|nr:hypothetical protein [candidate division Zixibacteria bacterium]
MRYKMLFIILCLLILVSCRILDSNDDTSVQGKFKIKVVDIQGQSISDATVSGGFDWDYFKTKTNKFGIALVPDNAVKHDVIISKTNYYPEVIPYISPGQYTLVSTPQRVAKIDDSEIGGKIISMESGLIMSIGYNTGTYHLYSYGDDGISELASSQIHTIIKDFEFHHDTLWFSTHDDGIFVYSVEDKYNPQLLFHLDIPGNSLYFSKHDSLVAVTGGEESIRIYSYDTQGNYTEKCNILQYSHYLKFHSNYLISFGGESLFYIFDLQQSVDPKIVYSGVNEGYYPAYAYNDLIFLKPRYYVLANQVSYKILNISDPSYPYSEGGLTSDASLIEIQNDSMATGYYCGSWESISILRGRLHGNMKTVATLYHSRSYSWIEGNPPYYIVDGQLWKLISK